MDFMFEKLKSFIKDESAMAQLIALGAVIVGLIVVIAIGANVGYNVINSANIPADAGGFYNSTTQLGTNYESTTGLLFVAAIAAIGAYSTRLYGYVGALSLSECSLRSAGASK
jgi:hypothetical protein